MAASFDKPYGFLAALGTHYSLVYLLMNYVLKINITTTTTTRHIIYVVKSSAIIQYLASSEEAKILHLGAVLHHRCIDDAVLRPNDSNTRLIH